MAIDIENMTAGQIKRQRTKEVVQELIERDGDFCQFYDCPYDRYVFTNSNFRSIDHVVPRSAGGADHIDNYVLMHFKCNNKKGSRQYLDDGTLEPLPYREPKSTVVKRDPYDCCNEGHSLGEGEICDVCGSEPQPVGFPKWAQRSLAECDHDKYHCRWCVTGFVDRVPASVSALRDYPDGRGQR